MAVILKIIKLYFCMGHDIQKEVTRVRLLKILYTDLLVFSGFYSLMSCRIYRALTTFYDGLGSLVGNSNCYYYDITCL